MANALGLLVAAFVFKGDFDLSSIRLDSAIFQLHIKFRDLGDPKITPRLHTFLPRGLSYCDSAVQDRYRSTADRWRRFLNLQLA